jgi:hypothetical protein
LAADRATGIFGGAANSADTIGWPTDELASVRVPLQVNAALDEMASPSPTAARMLRSTDPSTPRDPRWKCVAAGITPLIVRE